jgi:uncharacterized protein YqhQ
MSRPTKKKREDKPKIEIRTEIDMSEIAKSKHIGASGKNKQAISEHDQEPMVIDMVGGQAVTEGVLMRNSTHYAIAVRTPNGIKIKKGKLNLLTKKYKILGIPIIRGVISFFDSMSLGVKALTWSSNQALGTDEQLSKKEMAGVIITAILLSLFLFVGLPFLLTSFISRTNKGLLFNLIEGVIRVAILILYIWGISLMKEVKTLFRYHGAEHQAVNCYEAGVELTPKNLRRFSTIHPRCGTSFLIIIALVSILVFSFIPGDAWYIKLASRLLLVPLIMGFSYELLKFSAKHRKNLIVKILIAPGLLMQRITTQKPTDRQAETAIRALKELL